jgi:hypothetical protein
MECEGKRKNDLEREVAVRLDPLGERGVHDSLTGWANGNGLSQSGLAGAGYPGNLWGKVGNVVLAHVRWERDEVKTCLLALQSGLRHKEREVGVLNSQSLDLGVKKVMDELPDAIGPGTKHIAAADLIKTIIHDRCTQGRRTS